MDFSDYQKNIFSKCRGYQEAVALSKKLYKQGKYKTIVNGIMQAGDYCPYKDTVIWGYAGMHSRDIDGIVFRITGGKFFLHKEVLTRK